jgi:putative nucleotidyltransferase with HDIG domain
MLAAEAVVLAIAIAAIVLLAPSGGWDPLAIALLGGFAIASDLSAVSLEARKVKLSGSLLAIVTAIVLLGPAPAAAIGLATILTGWAASRYSAPDLLINLVTYAWFPLLAGEAFIEGAASLSLTEGDPSFYLLVFALFIVALLIDAIIIAAYTVYVDGSASGAKLRRVFLPLVPSELAGGLLAVGVTIAYDELGLAAVALFGFVLLIFQRLVGELLLSQDRATELELRAKQLAGFQVALLGALLRTLDLRDRMTARHSASVARVSRELAARAGFSETDQELAHTAGLLHDIGKFILPDEVLKSRGRLSPDDWEQIRRHPYEGARIVSQIDGYRPVGDIIMAHHERIDGLGYPRGLRGDDIPELARIVAIGDAYDAMTSRDSYAEPKSSFEAIVEMRRVSGTQLDARYVELFIEMLADKDLAYRHGEDVDFEAELALDKRIHDYVGLSPAAH